MYLPEGSAAEVVKRGASKKLVKKLTYLPEGAK